MLIKSNSIFALLINLPILSPFVFYITSHFDSLIATNLIPSVLIYTFTTVFLLLVLALAEEKKQVAKYLSLIFLSPLIFVFLYGIVFFVTTFIVENMQTPGYGDGGGWLIIFGIPIFLVLLNITAVYGIIITMRVYSFFKEVKMEPVATVSDIKI